MFGKGLLTAFCSVVLVGLTFIDGAPALLAQSTTETSTENNVQKENGAPGNFLGIRGNPIQIPQEGLSDEDKETLVQLNAIVDALSSSSNVDEILEKCNETSTALFREPENEKSHVSPSDAPDVYYALSFDKPSFSNGVGISYIALYNTRGQVWVERFSSVDGKSIPVFSDDLYKSPIVSDLTLQLFERAATERVDFLPNQPQKAHEHGDVISIIIFRYDSQEHLEGLCFIYFHANGMPYALFYMRSSETADQTITLPERDLGLAHPDEFVKSFKKWDADGKLFKNHLFEKPLPFRLPPVRKSSSQK